MAELVDGKVVENGVRVDDVKNHPMVKKVIAGLRITKVVCTRSIKGRSGDHYVGFAAAWESTQDDAGGAAGLVATLSEEETRESEAQTGLTLKEGRVASLILGMQADRSAVQNAFAGGNISGEGRRDALASINSNYMKLIQDLLAETPVPKSGE